MRVSVIALILAVVLLIVGGSFVFRRPINWSTASSAVAEIEPSNVATDTGKGSPVIVELFTSEGCSSCPPADKVLAELEKTQPVADAEIIVLSEHVDYWNYIGWSDPFSSELFSARQQAYASVFNNDGVYTPQMVVDGQAEFVGSNSEKARTAITRLAKLPKADVMVVPALKNQSDANSIKLKVSVGKLPKLNPGDVAEVMLAITESSVSSQVVRGENSGRKLNHTSVVRELRSIGSISDSGKSFEAETTAMFDKDWKRNNLRAVAFVQERRHKRILGAAAANLAGE